MKRIFYWLLIICACAGPTTASAWFVMLAGSSTQGVAYFLVDTFDETSNTVLTSHSPETGGTWSTTGSGAPTVYESTDTVKNTVSDISASYNSASPPSANYSVSAIVKTVGTGSGDWGGPSVRMQSDGSSYTCTIFGTGDVGLHQKGAGGAFVEVIDTNTITSFNANTEYTITITATGTTIECIAGGVGTSGTDSDISSAGKAGMTFRDTNVEITEITANSTVAYFFDSDFEDATDRSQWTDTGTPQKDYSSAGLDMGGSYVALLDNGEGITETFTAIDNVYFLQQMRFETSLGANRYISSIKDSSSNNLCVGQFATGGSVFATDLTLTSSNLYIPIAADNTYWIKLYYNKGTGANAVCGIGHWNGSSWDTREVTTSAKTAQAGKVNNYNPGSEIWYFDNVFLFTSDYTSNPNSLVP